MKSKVVLPFFLLLFFLFLVGYIMFDWRTKWNLNVYIIPYTHVRYHSHFSSSVRRTDEKGEDTREQDAFQIIESVLDAMKQDHRYRFNWPDTHAFAAWYGQASDSYLALANQLIAEKRFYFVGGGWVTHDEATPDYRSVIQQMTAGQQFLFDHFGVVPSVGWQVGSYGESAVTPSLFSMLGIDAIVNDRVGDSLKKVLNKREAFNFVWEGHKIDQDMSQHRLFAHTTIGSYQMPEPFDFADESRIHCMDPYIDKIYSRPFFEQVIEPLIDSYDETEDIAFLFGADDSFADAYSTFYCIDNYMAEIQRLVRHWTNYKWMTYRFATIDEYLDQVNKVYTENNLSFPFLKGNLLPYDELTEDDTNRISSGSSHSEFWTGFYSTRPVLKQKIKDLFHDLRSLASLYSINSIRRKELGETKSSELFLLLEEAAQNASLMLSHNSITGVHSQSTYQKEISQNIDSTKRTIESLIEQVHLSTLTLESKIQGIQVKVNQHKQDNTSEHIYLEGLFGEELHPVVLFNPDIYERRQIVNITVHGQQAVLFDQNLEWVQAQIMDCYALDLNQSQSNFNIESLECIPMTVTKILYFEIELMPMETKVYFVRHIQNKQDCIQNGKNYCAQESNDSEINSHLEGTLENEYLRVELNNMYLPKSIQFFDNSESSFDLIAELYEYHTEGSYSDFYVFQPRNEAEKPALNFLAARKQVGPLVSQINFFGTISSDQSSKSNDVFEFIVTLAKHSKFPILTVKLGLNNFKEVAIRFEVKRVMGAQSTLYVSDSMFFTQHEHISLSQAKQRSMINYEGKDSINNSTLGLNAYAAVKGAALKKDEDIFWTVNSHTMTCHYLEQVYEYILHRSIDRTSNKGVTGILNDTEVATVHIAIGMSRHEQFKHDVLQADQLINERISISPLTQINATLEEFVKQYSTQSVFIKQYMFPDEVELVGFETKQSGDTFIKLRNKSNSTIELSSHAFEGDKFYVDGNSKYMLNGLKLEDQFFEYEKRYFPTKTDFNIMKLLKKNFMTLEEQLPPQISERNAKVMANVEGSKRVAFLSPFELATYKIVFG